MILGVLLFNFVNYNRLCCHRKTSRCSVDIQSAIHFRHRTPPPRHSHLFDFPDRFMSSAAFQVGSLIRCHYKATNCREFKREKRHVVHHTYIHTGYTLLHKAYTYLLYMRSFSLLMNRVLRKLLQKKSIWMTCCIERNLGQEVNSYHVICFLWFWVLIF